MSSQPEVKKKRPPTFQHLPLNRAKKLKKDWVQVHKIKSQWKAQKRKEGLYTSHTVAQDIVDDRSKDGSDGEDQPNSDDRPSDNSRQPHSSDDDLQRRRITPKSRARISAEEGATPPRRREPTVSQKFHKEMEEDKPNLRELQRQAYSRSSLHTYKSGKRDDKKFIRGNSEYRGDQKREHRKDGRKSGQPDMRLRMNAMLEKIKRDLA